MAVPEFTIIGSGLAGISTSYHLGHGNCVVFEKNTHPYGHIHSVSKNGFTWDEGPHVSFTKHTYVKKIFEDSVNGQILEYPVWQSNYYKGNWVPHPAQSNLYAVPEPLRSECLQDFLASRQHSNTDKPADYAEWLNIAFGKTFTENFASPYTKKYWTVSPDLLTTGWVGERVFFPDVDTVKKGFEGPLESSTHYITKVRYPRSGGYQQFAAGMLNGMNVQYDKEIIHINPRDKIIDFAGGGSHKYENLISTAPLPQLIGLCDAPANVKNAAAQLICSELLLVNIEVDHGPKRTEQWLYVYDEDKYATRINFTDLLSPNNAPKGKCGIQVEVYFSAYKPKVHDDSFYARKVIAELIEMGLIADELSVANYHTRFVKYANVIFDHNYLSALDVVLDWLSQYGLRREADDLQPMTNWEDKFTSEVKLGQIVLAGRFGQWKYYWTDDCVLRGKFIKQSYAKG